jgi:selenophosphate synthase
MKRSCAITPAVLAQTLWNATKQNEFTYFLPQLDVAKHKYDFGTGHDNVAFTW